MAISESKLWDKIFDTQPWGRYPAEDFVRFVKTSFKSSNKLALEVGCGTGAQLWFLLREGFTVCGMDGSKSAIKLAKKRLDDEIPCWKHRANLIIGDMVKIPFCKETFDLVIDNEAVSTNSFEKSKRIYNEMARVCKKGGKLFSRTFATNSWGDKTGRECGHRAYHVGVGPLLNKGYSRFTDIDEIPELTKGFRLDSVELLSRTVNDQSMTIKEWIITGTK